MVSIEGIMESKKDTAAATDSDSEGLILSTSPSIAAAVGKAPEKAGVMIPTAKAAKCTFNASLGLSLLPLDLAAIRNLVLLRASSEAMMAAAIMTPRGSSARTSKAL